MIYEDKLQEMYKQEGIEIGREQEKFAIAEKMLREGLSASLIAKVTGLSPVEIETID